MCALNVNSVTQFRNSATLAAVQSQLPSLSKSNEAVKQSQSSLSGLTETFLPRNMTLTAMLISDELKFCCCSASQTFWLLISGSVSQSLRHNQNTSKTANM